MDTALFLWLHGFAGHSSLGDWLIVFCGEYLLYVILLGLVVLALWEAYESALKALYAYAVMLAAAVVARYVLTPLIRDFYHHLRPYAALSVPHLLTDTSYSFPSGHTIFIFALGASAHALGKRGLAYVLYAAGLVVGIARVMGGVHYPSDILGGIILGAFVGYVSVRIYRAL